MKRFFAVLFFFVGCANITAVVPVVDVVFASANLLLSAPSEIRDVVYTA